MESRQGRMQPFDQILQKLMVARAEKTAQFQRMGKNVRPKPRLFFHRADDKRRIPVDREHDQIGIPKVNDVDLEKFGQSLQIRALLPLDADQAFRDNSAEPLFLRPIFSAIFFRVRPFILVSRSRFEANTFASPSNSWWISRSGSYGNSAISRVTRRIRLALRCCYFCDASWDKSAFLTILCRNALANQKNFKTEKDKICPASASLRPVLQRTPL